MATTTGGDKFQKHLARIREAASQPAVLRVGFLEKAKYPDGTPVAMVGATQNYGAPRAGIPPRPFFTNMIANKKPEWGPAAAELLKEHDYDVRIVLDLMGYAIAGQLRESIGDTNDPPLSPITLMLRLMRSEDQTLRVTGRTVGIAAGRVSRGESAAGVVSTKPLVWSKHMLNSVDHEVEIR